MNTALYDGRGNRLQHVDIARGIAIICIVLGHLSISSINRIVFTFHVPIFFFITGYFMHVGESEAAFIKKKARTLLVPYAVTCVVIIVLGTVVSLCASGLESAIKSLAKWSYAAVYGAGDNYSHPFYIKGIGAIWFLWATFWGTIVLHQLIGMNVKHRIAIILLVFTVSYWSSKYVWLPFSIQAGGVALLFMYFGYCLRKCISSLREIAGEVKAVWTIFSFVIWVAFIRDFQSFWLVHCDMGRGVIDVFGCVCACYCIMFLAKAIGQYTHRLSDSLSYLGRYSIIMLCVHIIELDVFPWKTAIKGLNSVGMPDVLNTAMLIIGKLLLDISATVVLSKSKFIRRLFALKV